MKKVYIIVRTRVTDGATRFQYLVRSNKDYVFTAYISTAHRYDKYDEAEADMLGIIPHDDRKGEFYEIKPIFINKNH